MTDANSGAGARAILRNGDAFDVSTTVTERQQVEGDYDDVTETEETGTVIGLANRPSPAERSRTAISDGPSVDMSVTLIHEESNFGAGVYGAAKYDGTAGYVRVSDGDLPGTSPSIMTIYGRTYRVVFVGMNPDGTLSAELTKV